MEWFVRKGIFFKPKSVVGWVIFVAIVVFAIYSFFEIYSHHHSVNDTLTSWFMRMFLLGMVYSIVGYFASKE